MEFPGVASIGGFAKSVSMKLAFRSFSVLIVLASCSFLVYKLCTFQQYEVLFIQWKQMPLSRLWWLAGLLFLLPLNWFLEALKWKFLTSPVQKINITTSIKSVLSGVSTGFFTPNRVGELVGRIAFLEPENRKAGITLSLVNSLTQNVVMACCGILACILFLSVTAGGLQPDMFYFISILMVGVLVLGAVYFTLPRWSLQFKLTRLSVKLKGFTDCLSGYNLRNLLQIILVSFLRYGIFCTQLYFMLRFFHVELTPWQALIAIPTTYLFVTFTPSLAFSEAAVRSSYAVLVVGAFSPQVVNIALAGVCIWTVNVVVPMLAGSVLIIGKKS